MTEEEDLVELYNIVKKAKTKGYVRLITTEGMLNLELHTNIVPRTTDNFLRLCEKEYYNGTLFHRLIQNFMMQGGDFQNKDGTGGECDCTGVEGFEDWTNTNPHGGEWWWPHCDDGSCFTSQHDERCEGVRGGGC